MSPTRRDLVRDVVRVALAGAAAAALPTVAGAEGSAVDVPTLPSDRFGACIFMWGHTPDGGVTSFHGSVDVEPDANGGPPRLLVSIPFAELTDAQRRDVMAERRREVDVSAEPELHRAAADLIAALFAAADTPLLGKRTR